MSHTRGQLGTIALVSLWLGWVVTAVAGQPPGEQSTPESAPPVTTADPVLVVKISERLLTDLLREPVREEGLVHHSILGTPIRGTALTYCRVYFDCVESHEQARFWLLLGGQTTADTVGYNYPAQVHSTTVTRFVAGKHITYNPTDHFQIKPARILSETDRYTRGIQSALPGLRGAIVRRVAALRMAEQRGAIQAEAERLAQKRVTESFDRQVQEQLGNFEKRLALVAERLEQNPQERDYVWNIATDHRFLIVAGSERPTGGEPPPRSLAGLSLPQPPRDDSLVEVWQHNRFDLTDAQSIECSYQVLKIVFRILSNSETIPPQYRTNFKLLAELDSDVTQHRHWSVVQLYRE